MINVVPHGIFSCFHEPSRQINIRVISVAEWLAGWITKPAMLGSIPDPVAADVASCNSALGDYCLGLCCQQC